MDISNLNYRSLSVAVNKIVSPSTFLQDLFFSNRIARETNIIDIDVIVGNKKLAPVVSPLSAGKVVGRLGRQMSTVKAPSVKIKKPLPASMFSEREAGTSIYLNGQDRQKAQLAKIGREQKDLKDQTVRRIEWFVAQALQGSITVDNEDVKLNIDFGLPANNKPVLIGTAKWNDTTKNVGGTAADDTISNPGVNIDDWTTIINQATGLNATDIVLGQNATKSFKHHPRIKGELDKTNGQGKGSNWLGRYNNMDVWSYSEQYIDDNGTPQNMLNPNACLLVARCSDFELNFGAIDDIEAGAPVITEFFSKTWEEKDPSAMWLLVDSHPLPVPKKVEAIVYAIVQ